MTSDDIRLPPSSGGDADSWSYRADGAIRHKDSLVQNGLPSFDAGDRIRMTLAGGVLAWHINGQRAAEVRGVPSGAHFGVGRLSSGPFEVRLELPAHLPHPMACNGLPHLMACNGLPHLMACNGLPHQVRLELPAHLVSLAGEMRTSLEVRAELTGLSTCMQGNRSLGVPNLGRACRAQRSGDDDLLGPKHASAHNGAPSSHRSGDNYLLGPKHASAHNGAPSSLSLQVTSTTPSLPASLHSQQQTPYEPQQQGAAQQAAAAILRRQAAAGSSRLQTPYGPQQQGAAQQAAAAILGKQAAAAQAAVNSRLQQVAAAQVLWEMLSESGPSMQAAAEGPACKCSQRRHAPHRSVDACGGRGPRAATVVEL
jgi:hypothetical protein